MMDGNWEQLPIWLNPLAKTSLVGGTERPEAGDVTPGGDLKQFPIFPGFSDKSSSCDLLLNNRNNNGCHFHDYFS